MKRLVVLFAIAAVVAFSWGPLLWTLVTSLKPPSELTRLPPILPTEITFQSYPAVFDPERHFGRVLLNSLIVATVTTVFALLVGASAASALARLEFPGRRILLSAALAVSPLVRSAKKFSAAGVGPSGRGVHADSVAEATTTTRIETRPVTRVANEVQVAIETDVMSP